MKFSVSSVSAVAPHAHFVGHDKMCMSYSGNGLSTALRGERAEDAEIWGMFIAAFLSGVLPDRHFFQKDRMASVYGLLLAALVVVTSAQTDIESILKVHKRLQHS